MSQLLQHTGLPLHLTGDKVIAVKSTKGLQGSERAAWEGFIDNNNISYNNGNSAYNLGLISSWAMQGQETYPVISELLQKNAEIEVDGFDGAFQYEKPFYDLQQGLRTTASSADQGYDLGQDQSEFYIYLSEKVYPNDILGTDIYYNDHQLKVVSCEPAELSGNSWKAVVQLTNPNPEAVYPQHLLEPNVQYTRLDHRVSEYDTDFTGVELPFNNGMGTIKAEFRLGGVRGVEGYVTGFADAKKRGFAASNFKESDATSIKDVNGQVYNNLDPTDLILMAKPNGKGGFDRSTARATTYMEYQVEQTLMKRTARSHMWNKFGTFTDSNGAMQYINEGLWHQMRRGKIIEYSAPGGITRVIIGRAAEYIYQNNPSLDWTERKIKFKAGREAYNNMLELFQDEVQMHIQRLESTGVFKFLFGNDGQIPKSPISGNLDSLKLELIQFTDVPLIGIAGSVTVEHDPSLDYMPGMDFQHSGNHARGKAWSTYSMVIWDVTDQNFTNNMAKLPEGNGVKTYNEDSNVYLVRPEGNMVYKGRSNGRWDMGKGSDIISSSKYIAQEFWAFNSSALWLRDPSKVVIIELAPGARKGAMNRPY